MPPLHLWSRVSVLQPSRLRLSDQRCVYLGIFYLDRDDECLRGGVLCEQVGSRSKGERGGADGGLSGGQSVLWSTGPQCELPHPGPWGFKANISLRLGALLIILRARAGSRRERMRLSLEACMCVRVYLLQHGGGSQTWTQGRELSKKKKNPKNSHCKHITQEGSLRVVYILKPDRWSDLLSGVILITRSHFPLNQALVHQAAKSIAFQQFFFFAHHQIYISLNNIIADRLHSQTHSATLNCSSWWSVWEVADEYTRVVLLCCVVLLLCISGFVLSPSCSLRCRCGEKILSWASFSYPLHEWQPIEGRVLSSFHLPRSTSYEFECH